MEILKSENKYKKCGNCTYEKCELCGKHIDSLVFDLKRYAYKIPDGNTFKYFCSWKCIQEYRKKNNIK